MRSQTAQGSSQAASSAPRSNATVDLFSNWTTDYSVQVGKSTGASSAQDKDLSTEIQIKRSLSQESADASNARSSPRFQTINFPKKDAFASISLSKDSNEDDEGLYKDGKKVPPSKRPGVSHAKKTPPNHIKRPRNAYIIFRTTPSRKSLYPKRSSMTTATSAASSHTCGRASNRKIAPTTSKLLSRKRRSTRVFIPITSTSLPRAERGSANERSRSSKTAKRNVKRSPISFSRRKARKVLWYEQSRVKV